MSYKWRRKNSSLLGFALRGGIESGKKRDHGRGKKGKIYILLVGKDGREGRDPENCRK